MSSTAALQSNPFSATVITREGLARLEAELEQLKTAGRDEIAERLRAAISTDARRSSTR